jgi:uncharacterized membrane protein affecting hemolysin expression
VILKNSLSLKNQLIFIILLATLFSTTLSFSFSIIYDFLNSRNDLKNSMQFTARLMAENVKSPLLFNDELGANELLLSFKSIPMVLNAKVIDAKGAVFASYGIDNNMKRSLLPIPVLNTWLLIKTAFTFQSLLNRKISSSVLFCLRYQQKP